MFTAVATLYDLLGVDPKVKPNSLRQAYRNLARSCHPDVNPDPSSHEQMAKINAAFEVLIDPVRRMEYDASLNGGYVEDPTSEQDERRGRPLVRARIVGRLRNHKTPIYGASFTGDGLNLVTSSFDNELIWWDLVAGESKGQIRLEGGVVSLVTAINPTFVVAAGCSESNVNVWRLNEGKISSFRSLPREWVCCLGVSPDGAYLAMGSVNRQLEVCRTDTAEVLFSVSGHGESITSVSWSKDGRYLATGSADATVKIWSAADGANLATFENVRSTVTSLQFSLDGRLLAAAAVDLSIRVFDIRARKLDKVLFGHERPIEALAFHPSAELLASAGRDGIVGIWNVRDGSGHGKIDASHHAVSAVAFSPDGGHLVAGGMDKMLRIWRLSQPA